MTTLMHRASVLALAASAALLLAACGNKDQQSGPTVATVNGVAIKESKVDAQLKPIPPQLLQGHEAEARRQIIDQLVDQELIRQEAQKEHVTSDDTYKKQLEAVMQQLQANTLLANVVKEKVTEPVLQKVYEVNKAKLAFPAVKARHILVPTEEQAENILKIATPQNFADLAEKYSKGPTAKNGGELGWFRREAMIPEFANVAFNTPVGSVAKSPVKTQFGWHVILVEDRNDHYVPPFKDVEGQLRQEMTQNVVQGYLADLRKNATITYASDDTAASSTAPAEGAASTTTPAPAK